MRCELPQSRLRFSNGLGDLGRRTGATPLKLVMGAHICLGEEVDGFLGVGNLPHCWGLDKKEPHMRVPTKPRDVIDDRGRVVTVAPLVESPLCLVETRIPFVQPALR